MIGLIFYGVIVLWLLVSVALALKIPKWLSIKSQWAALFAPILFFALIADELVAWPQVQLLCGEFRGYVFAEEMNEESAAGRTVYYKQTAEPFFVFPSTIKVKKWRYLYIDAVTKEPVFVMHDLGVESGWLQIPSGSSGTSMTALLKGCSRSLAIENQKLQSIFNNLGIAEVPSP